MASFDHKGASKAPLPHTLDGPGGTPGPSRPGPLLEFTIHGRGGQGAQVGAHMLAAAFLRAGRHVQAFAAYGGERRGAPVTAFVRVDDAPIHLRCDIEQPDHALVLDASQMPAVEHAGLRGDGVMVVNSSVAPCSRMPGGLRIAAVDASTIARAAGLGSIVAPAVLGAFAAATGLVTLDDLVAAVREWSPDKPEANAEACAIGYREMADLDRVEA